MDTVSGKFIRFLTDFSSLFKADEHKKAKGFKPWLGPFFWGYKIYTACKLSICCHFFYFFSN